MGKVQKVQINPDVLRWAIEGSGWDTDELSEKTGISNESIRRWKESISGIDVSDLRKISKTIKMPLLALLLPEPPAESALTDYRVVGGKVRKKLSKETLVVVRRARYVQSSAREMLEMRSEDVRPNVTFRTLEDDPEIVAAKERKALGVEFEKRSSGEDIDRFVRAAYQNLRGRIESNNIFVMQAAMDVREARGFTLTGEHPKVILVNSKDAPRPKFFTLLHEYAHILLKTDGICLTDSENLGKRPSGQAVAIERWCNNFAGGAIMPREKVMEELSRVADHEPRKVTDSISRKFCVSKAAAAMRMFNLLDKDPRRKEYIEYYEEISSKPLKTHGGGGGKGLDKAKQCISRNGKRYVKLVSDSRDRDLITINDMIRHLDLKTKHFEALGSQV